MVEVDRTAKRIASRKFGLPESLHIPIAARSLVALSRFVGYVENVKGVGEGAYLVRLHEEIEIDQQLEISNLENSSSLHATEQVWAHSDFDHYRGAFKKALPDIAIEGLVLDHIYNRRVARITDSNLFGSYRFREDPTPVAVRLRRN